MIKTNPTRTKAIVTYLVASPTKPKRFAEKIAKAEKTR